MLNYLRSIVQEVNSAKDFDEVLQIIVTRVKKATNTGVCSIYLHDPKDDSFVLTATDGLRQEAVGRIRLKRDQGLVGLVAAREEPLTIEDAHRHPRFVYFPESGEEQFSSFLGAPIIHQRKVRGVLVVQQVDHRHFYEGEESFLVTISAQLAGVIAHAEATGALTRVITPDLSEEHAEAYFRGIASAPGISIGTAVVVSSPSDLYAVAHRTTNDMDRELDRFHNALEQTRTDLRTVHQGLADKLNVEERALFDVYISMLDENSLGGEVSSLIATGLSAETAWSQAVIEHIRNFKSMEDAYLRERASDVHDLGQRVLAYLQQSREIRTQYPENAILVGEDLAAPNLADVPVEVISAMVSVRGSRNSHMAILGRALGIPTIMGAVDLPWRTLDGCQIIVDGNQGQVIINPSAAVLSVYEGIYREQKLLDKHLEILSDQPSVTADNQRIALWVNTGLRMDSRLSVDRGAEGVGLFRSEVPFLTRDRFPSEEEQRLIYREQLEMFAPLPVTIRTLDIGGDKSLPYFPIEEANPFLGWRGIRVSLDHPEIFLTQLRSMMRASEGLNNLRILLPMISNVQEIEASVELINRVHRELTEEEELVIARPDIGAMIEVPAAVYQVRQLARRVDFLSVGTNDLTQYLLAVDRNNPQVADLYHAFHPGLLMALQQIVDGAVRENCQISVCGEMAGDPLGALLLVGMGYRVLSMSATNLLRVKAILRLVTMKEAQKLAREVVKLSDHGAVVRHIENNLTNPEIVRLYKASLSETN